MNTHATDHQWGKEKCILSYSGLRPAMTAVAIRLVLPQRTTGIAMMRKVDGVGLSEVHLNY
jgi:hypothetical protein